ncbi:polysaccharide biosynthesis/export family protein [uncultured Sphingomonas sp.]|uniref:polysaccharide biosynthesis/export family protein n=1 Tax=uncultured Sphingomonas sp. TaxID=158754 RepID=UPI0026011C80|nr:polysaccharide biosynthesis/export family protein [uncultured Sphingomonas sp.]
MVRVDADKLPAPVGADYSASDAPYMLGPLDEVTVSVAGMDELSQKLVQVDASGRFSVPLAGTLEAAGKTPNQVATMIRDRLRQQYIRDPQVAVNLVRTVSQTVTIEGEVKKPGIYPVLGRMSLLRAIAAAEGVTEFAKLQDVVILRRVGGKDYAALYNLRAIRRAQYDDPDVYSGDVVMVDESRGRRMFRNFLQLAPLLSAPLIVALQKA